MSGENFACTGPMTMFSSSESDKKPLLSLSFTWNCCCHVIMFGFSTFWRYECANCRPGCGPNMGTPIFCRSRGVRWIEKKEEKGTRDKEKTKRGAPEGG